MDYRRLTLLKLRNHLQTAGLVLLLAFLLGYLAWFLGGEPFLWGAMLAVALLYLVNPAGSPRLVLSMYRARPIRVGEAPRLYGVLERLSRRAGLARRPGLYYLPTSALNAFSTGHADQAVIALSDGLLRRMDMRELTGVLAHEVAHVRNGDIRVMAFADLVSRITGLLSLAGQFLLILCLPLFILGADLPPLFPMLVLLAAPSLSALVQLALSRRREFEADLTAAEISGDASGLAMALAKLERRSGPLWEQLVMPGRRMPEPSLLRTHPPTEERIRRLLELVPQSPRAVQHASWLDDLTLDPLDWSGQPPGRRPRWHLNGLWY